MTGPLTYTMPADTGEQTQIIPKLSDEAKSCAARIFDNAQAEKNNAKEYRDKYIGRIEAGIQSQDATEIADAATYLHPMYMPGLKKFTIEKDLGERALQVCIESKVIWEIAEILTIMKNVNQDLGEKALIIRMESREEDKECQCLAIIAKTLRGENALKICLDSYSNSVTSNEIGCLAQHTQIIGQDLGIKAINICITENNAQALGVVIKKMREIEQELGERALRICVKKEDPNAIDEVIKKMKKVNVGLGKKALEICVHNQKNWSWVIPDIASKMGYTQATAYILEIASNDLCERLAKEAWFLASLRTLTGTPSESPESVPEKVVSKTKERVSKHVPARMIPANFPRKDDTTPPNKKQ